MLAHPGGDIRGHLGMSSVVVRLVAVTRIYDELFISVRVSGQNTFALRAAG